MISTFHSVEDDFYVQLTNSKTLNLFLSGKNSQYLKVAEDREHFSLVLEPRRSTQSQDYLHHHHCQK